MQRKCSEVQHPDTRETANIFLRKELLRPGVLLWDFHANEGHVLTEKIDCNDEHYCGTCGGMAKHKYWTCECGQVWPGDWHHYEIIMIPVDETKLLPLRRRP